MPPSFSVAAQVMGDTVFLTGENTKKITLFPGIPPTLSREPGKAGLARDAAMLSLLSFNAGFSLVQTTNSITSDGLKTMQLLTSTLAKAPAAPGVPDSFLGRQLQQVAQIIQVRSGLKASRQIFFCAMEGFDTSISSSFMVPCFQQLSQGIEAFYGATEALGVASQVTTFTASDFNRTCQPNSLGGYDHGWGGHHLVVGGAVKRNVYGQLPELLLNGGDDTDTRGVWIPSISLDQYAATLGGWLGVPAPDFEVGSPELTELQDCESWFHGRLIPVVLGAVPGLLAELPQGRVKRRGGTRLYSAVFCCILLYSAVSVPSSMPLKTRRDK